MQKFKKIFERIIIENLINKKVYSASQFWCSCNWIINNIIVVILPEGFHTDGVDFVAIIPINQKIVWVVLLILKNKKKTR